MFEDEQKSRTSVVLPTPCTPFSPMKNGVSLCCLCSFIRSKMKGITISDLSTTPGGMLRSESGLAQCRERGQKHTDVAVLLSLRVRVVMRQHQSMRSQTIRSSYLTLPYSTPHPPIPLPHWAWILIGKHVRCRGRTEPLITGSLALVYNQLFLLPLPLLHTTIPKLSSLSTWLNNFDSTVRR